MARIMAAYCTTAIYGNWSHLTGGRPIVEVLERLQVRAVQCTVERVQCLTHINEVRIRSEKIEAISRFGQDSLAAED